VCVFRSPEWQKIIKYCQDNNSYIKQTFSEVELSQIRENENENENETENENNSVSNYNDPSQWPSLPSTKNDIFHQNNARLPNESNNEEENNSKFNSNHSSKAVSDNMKNSQPKEQNVVSNGSNSLEKDKNVSKREPLSDITPKKQKNESVPRNHTAQILNDHSQTLSSINTNPYNINNTNVNRFEVNMRDDHTTNSSNQFVSSFGHSTMTQQRNTNTSQVNVLSTSRNSSHVPSAASPPFYPKVPFLPNPTYPTTGNMNQTFQQWNDPNVLADMRHSFQQPYPQYVLIPLSNLHSSIFSQLNVPGSFSYPPQQPQQPQPQQQPQQQQPQPQPQPQPQQQPQQQQPQQQQSAITPTTSTISPLQNPELEFPEQENDFESDYKCIFKYSNEELLFTSLKDNKQFPITVFQMPQNIIKIEVSTYNLHVFKYRLIEIDQSGSLKCIIGLKEKRNKQNNVIAFSSAIRGFRHPPHGSSTSFNLMVLISSRLFHPNKTIAYCKWKKDKFILLLSQK
jgi:hypothetical protein